MHDGMQYDPIQGQDHKPYKVGNPATFKSYLLRHLQWQLTTENRFLNYSTISKFDLPEIFLYLTWFLCHVTLKLAETSVVKRRPSVPYGANLFTFAPTITHVV